MVCALFSRRRRSISFMSRVPTPVRRDSLETAMFRMCPERLMRCPFLGWMLASSCPTAYPCTVPEPTPTRKVTDGRFESTVKSSCGHGSVNDCSSILDTCSRLWGSKGLISIGMWRGLRCFSTSCQLCGEKNHVVGVWEVRNIFVRIVCSHGASR